jgi:hypothetical protein
MKHKSTASKDADHGASMKCRGVGEEGCTAGAGPLPGQEQPGSPAHRPAQHVTTQAERAVMHPEHLDTEWRYYQGAWHS